MDAVPTSGRAGPVVLLGEILLRLSAPDGELLLQSPQLHIAVGGAEANVAVGLARLGGEARLNSVVPDNPLGHAALAELRRWGVDTRGVAFGPGRMGLYFLTPGAGLRPAEVVYDRTGSAFASADPEAIDWDAALAGAAWLHLSGVTPAIGPGGAAAAVRAVAAANRLAVPVSFDGNYRAKLWADWPGDGPAIMRTLIAGADLAFVNDRDLALALGRSFERPAAEDRLGAAAGAAFEAFPRLARIAATLRTTHDADRHELSARLFARGAPPLSSRSYSLNTVVDRIGAGDAFAAGMLHGLGQAWQDQRALDFALAAACAKHTIRGDFNLATAADIEAILAGDAPDVRR
ncbi:MAG TPA: sugar kinase [Caulobacteraceae bacterium]|jgi:2-dehydro-3-deoxygluconokinase|nr:sugar kinase [Caulobacteraceae bacterium]